MILTLTGGGLTSERVLSVDAPDGLGAWHVAASYTTRVEADLAAAEATRGDRTLWKYWFPGFLLALAGWLAVTGLRGRSAQRAQAAPTPPGGDGAPDSPPAVAGRLGRKHHVSTSG